jgi:hypothetical protein
MPAAANLNPEAELRGLCNGSGTDATLLYPVGINIVSLKMSWGG